MAAVVDVVMVVVLSTGAATGAVHHPERVFRRRPSRRLGPMSPANGESRWQQQSKGERNRRVNGWSACCGRNEGRREECKGQKWPAAGMMSTPILRRMGVRDKTALARHFEYPPPERNERSHLNMLGYM